MATNYDISNNYIIVSNPDTDVSTSGMTLSGSVLSITDTGGTKRSVDLATTMTTKDSFTAFTANTEAVITGGTYASNVITFTSSTNTTSSTTSSTSTSSSN